MIARFANQLHYKRAAVLYENNSYGRGLADNFRRGFSGQILSFDPISGSDCKTTATLRTLIFTMIDFRESLISPILRRTRIFNRS